MSNKVGWLCLGVAVTLLVVGFGGGAAPAALAQATGTVTPGPTPTATPANRLAGLAACLNYSPDFGPERLGPEIPADAYDSGAPKCAGAKPPQNEAELAMFQRTYDIFSWQSFLAINWPVDASGAALGSFTDPGPPQWTAWKESYEVFLADGSAPAAWGAPRTLPAPPDCCSLPTAPELTDKTVRLLFEVNQVNSDLPLWDQNGNMVYYEVLLNDQEFDYVVRNQLFNIDGQIAYLAKYGTGIDPPFGNYDKNTGSIELKLAWKVLAEQDIPERFFTMDAYIADPGSQQWLKKKVGLVGLHIGHNTFSSRPWVWSTFEHVDNVQVDELEVLEYARQGQLLQPLFNDPACPICPVNVEPTPDAAGLRKTQVMRAVPISKATAALNSQVQALLKQQGSVWQYYELIGTQFATDNTVARASDDQGLPDRITNKSGGYPSPVYLVNSVIETYDQEGNQEASDLVQGPLNDAKQRVFGTQSCAGCHSIAGIAAGKSKDDNYEDQAFYVEGTGGFSWLMQTRARWKQAK